MRLKKHSATERPYKDIPTQGTYRDHAPAEELETGQNVRAPWPPDREGASDEPGTPTYYLLHDEAGDRYRLRSTKGSEETEAERGFQEIGRYTSEAELGTALEPFRSRTRHAVFENTETGEVYLDEEKNLSGDWTSEGRFNQVTLFDDASEAAAYAEARQGTPSPSE